MLTFLSENLATIIIGLVVLAVIAAIIVSLIRKKINNKGGCGCGCSGCPSSENCKGK